MDTYNSALLNLANYNDINVLKRLIINLNNLKKLAGMGDTVAAAIYIDLETAIYTPGVLTDKQRTNIVGHLIEGYSLIDMSWVHGKDVAVIHDSVQGGLKRISNALRDGAVYKREVK